MGVANREEVKMEIGIMGRAVKIMDVKAVQAGFIWPRQDLLMMYLSCSEVGQPAFGFVVHLPVKRYGKEEFLAKVKAEAEDGLSELLELDEEERERWMRGQERQEELDALVDEIKDEIGLLP